MSNQNRSLMRPGGELASRPLYFFWVADNSSSMRKEKIGALNNAIQSVIPEMKSVALDNPNAQVYIRTLRFSSGASWITPEPVPVEEFVWDDLEADGLTDMGKAFTLLSGQLSVPPMPERALPPVIVLISDGMPTDWLSLRETLNWSSKPTTPLCSPALSSGLPLWSALCLLPHLRPRRPKTSRRQRTQSRMRKTRSLRCRLKTICQSTTSPNPET